MNEKELTSTLPERIAGLGALAYNLWWSWTPSARELFRAIDLETWRACGYNPVRFLAHLSPDSLSQAAADPTLLARYDAVMNEFTTEMNAAATWPGSSDEGVLAYFSAEFGLHVSLPFYAGGLGILAGDYLKECSDSHLPVVGVGLLYSRGYTWQRVRDDGWPEDIEEILDRSLDPIQQVNDGQGRPLVVQIPLLDPPVHAAVWRINVGRIPLYLLDTDIDDNQPWDRAISHHLYTANLEQRLRQEITLGMGGMKVLEALGIRPSALHINEGHPALATLTWMQSLVTAGQSFDAARQWVQQHTVFTTHTPVAAGTDVFPFAMLDKYLSHLYAPLQTDQAALFQLGAHPENPGAGFNMTVFALRMARFSNAVSQKHGQVARQMWASLWPGKKVEDVPITAVTNGVHLPTWIDPNRLRPLLDEYLGADWMARQDDPQTWTAVDAIPDSTWWDAHRQSKSALLAQIDKRAKRRWRDDKVAATNVIAYGALLEPDVLTLGFARRFTGYKRPDLIFTDMERIKRLLSNADRPLQIIFAGKAHPADLEGKRLIQRIFRLAQDPAYAGRIAFVEDYDQQLARYLVHGVDVWLNNPLPPLEASGTSGMKAAANGTPNLSILDGWWLEGYQEGNGWAFGGDAPFGDRTGADAEALYRLLEEKIIPLYYAPSDDEMPHGFIQVMKKAMKSAAPAFSARRMVNDYVGQFYLPILA